MSDRVFSVIVAFFCFVMFLFGFFSVYEGSTDKRSMVDITEDYCLTLSRLSHPSDKEVESYTECYRLGLTPVK